jgi:hypothetical protein
LTESGLYEVLFLSRKPIAKEFKKGVKALLHDLRTGKKGLDGSPPGDLRTYLIGDRTITFPADTAFNVTLTPKGCVTVRVNGKMKADRPRKEQVREPSPDEIAVQRFLSECCEFDQNSKTRSLELYEVWRKWSKSSTDKAVFYKIFSRVVQDRFGQLVRKCFRRDKKYHRGHAYKGLRLRASDPPVFVPIDE